MRYFHTTTLPAAAAIERDGFRDGRQWIGGIELIGVWISDRPLDGNEGTKGDQLLVVDLPDDLDLSPHEVIEEGKPYREWIVPAPLVNAGVVRWVGSSVDYDPGALDVPDLLDVVDDLQLASRGAAVADYVDGFIEQLKRGANPDVDRITELKVVADALRMVVAELERRDAADD